MIRKNKHIDCCGFLGATIAVLLVIGGCDKNHEEGEASPKTKGPDLTFTGNYEFQFQRTVPPTGNDLYTMVVEVKNQGETPARDVHVVAHSRGPGIAGTRPPLDNEGYYSVGAGESVKARFQFIFEKQFGGEYEFTIRADDSNTIQEEDESNNELVFKRRF